MLSNRKIGNDIRKHGLVPFLFIFIFFKMVGYCVATIPYVLVKTLTLEQYYIFLFNSTLNTLKVAGTLLVTTKSEEVKAKVKLVNSKPFVILLDGKPIFFFPSSAFLTKLTGISSSTLNKAPKVQIDWFMVNYL